MHDKNSIKEERNFMEVLQGIANAYQQISVMKMKEARSYIEHSRTFVDNIKYVFESLKFSYPYLNLKQLRYSSKASKENAYVLITANAKFHGDILRKIFNLFKEHVDTKSDIFIVGRVGKEYIEEFNSSIDYQYFEIPDENIRMKNLLPLIDALMNYKQTHIYYAQFKSVIQQDPESLDINTIERLLEQGRLKKNQAKKTQVPLFMFEPSGEEIAQFLSDNVLVSLLRQSLYDTQLARYAARINAMNSLLNNIDDNMKTLDYEALKIKRDIENKKQLERISGVIAMG